jgi:very-short-patch-repair endonuclease
MDILEKYNVEIVEVDNIKYAKAVDIGKVLGLTNIHTSTIKFNNKEKTKLKSKDNKGVEQMSTFLTEKGLKRLLCASRKHLSIDLCMEFDLNLESKYIALETEFVSKLRKIFAEEEIIEQYNVDKYFLDIYFPEYKLAIEYDEHKHKYQQKADKERQEYISDKLECAFIRINENDCEYESFGKIHKLLLKILKENLNI